MSYDDLDPSLEFATMAALLRMESGESGDLLEFLAKKLEAAIPQHTRVKRSGGIFSKKKTVDQITVEFDENDYQIIRGSHGNCSARIAKKVRGIVLKTSEVPVSQWTDALAQELCTMAEKSADARDALQQLVRG